ncbi:PP2C family protein-serine/threonine phosphatase [Streptacidiphilus carbonis]|uniref:PP2C family protein-serine/threonine phosphatase n=1 Tax=Streptacidiphilus carbonis TaxID=105422 RepID=UPI000A02DBFF|nr:SpoIIE family protein phosphatase [Streptacidiphilus carbonis]
MRTPVRTVPTGAGVPTQAKAPTETYRILLVEDDAGDALLVEELLADTGLSHTLSWTQTMAGALADLGARTPDCVLLDLHLPDASGMGAIQTLEAACPQSAVIVLTGLAESRAGVLAVANGAQDYLVKGQVTADLLNRVVRYAVHRKQAERASAELRENRIHAQENTRLERGLLPAPLLRDDRVRASMRYLPGRQRALLGGDFLDVVQTGGDGDAGGAEAGTVHAVIGDVSGHGPDEAALGVCLRITWRALVLAGHRGSELLGLLEQVLVAERPRGDMFATCSTVTLDPRGQTATVYLAGHHEPLLCADGGARVVPAAHGPALGIMPGGGHWRPSEVALPDKGALLLYTDGLVEGYRGPGKDRLETEGLVALIADAPEQAADRLLDHLVSTAQTLNAGRHADDLAALHLSWD